MPAHTSRAIAWPEAATNSGGPNLKATSTAKGDQRIPSTKTDHEAPPRKERMTRVEAERKEAGQKEGREKRSGSKELAV